MANNPEFGDLKHIDLREIWKDEARDFTPWLAKNLDLLSAELGIDLEFVDSEVAVGSFSLDILAKELGANKNVVIENQLTPTDHDHLGKLITYASGFDASIAILIAESFRDEHRQALDWLNQRTDSNTQFFGIVPEVIQIDDSRPSVKFKLVVFPNDWQKDQGSTSRQPSERDKKYREYFQKLIDILRDEHKFTNAKKGQYQGWYSFSSGHSGVSYGANFASRNRARVELYMGSEDKNFNKSVFDQLYDDKDVIEKEFGEDFSWERIDNKKACKIAIYKEGSIDSDEATLAEILDWQIENLLRFKHVFSEKLSQAVEDAKTNGGLDE